MVWRSRPPSASDVVRAEPAHHGCHVELSMPLELVKKEAASLHEADPIEAQLREVDTLHALAGSKI